MDSGALTSPHSTKETVIWGRMTIRSSKHISVPFLQRSALEHAQRNVTLTVVRAAAARLLAWYDGNKVGSRLVLAALLSSLPHNRVYPDPKNAHAMPRAIA